MPSNVETFDLATFARLSLRNWMLGIRCLDLLGAAGMVLALSLFPKFSAQGTAAGHAAGYAAPGNLLASPSRFAAILVASVAIWLLAAHAIGLYHRGAIVAGRTTLLHAFMTCMLAFSIIFSVDLAAAPAAGPAGIHAVAAAVCATLWVMAARVCWHAGLRAMSRRGYCMDRVLVLAASATGARYAASAIERRHNGRIRVAGTARFPNKPDGPSYDWVEDAVRRNLVDRLVIAGVDQASDAYAEMLPWMTRLGADITFLPGRPGGDALALHAAPAYIEPGSRFVPPDDFALWPLSAEQALAKRGEDIVVATLLLLITLPLMLLIALAIKLDSPGPVFFIQKRVGLRGAVFPMWKFRTMHHHMQDHGSAQQTRRDDKRVTSVGRYLRRTSLDELPQLINVFRGDMSMVGPRPHALGMTVAGRQLKEIAEGYDARHLVKPGITGWAQVNGCRGEVDTERKLRRRLALDCHYIEHWSMRADAWIILRTATLFAFDRHAY
jgi:exopolysaccharide biosynthesis polyprenyl glycosylphosphotransferase